MTTTIQFITNHLFILITLIFALGIGLSKAIPINLTLTFLFLFLFGSGSLISHIIGKKPVTLCLTLCLFVLLGFLHDNLGAGKQENQIHIYNQITDDKEVVLIGTLHTLPGFDGEKSKIIVTDRKSVV